MNIRSERQSTEGGPAGYRKVLLKLSGNALAGGGGAVFAEEALKHISGEIADARNSGCMLAVVPGAGNILRGAAFSRGGDSRLIADNAGMASTVVNGLVLQQALEERGIQVCLCSALPLGGAVRAFERDRCREELKNGRVLVLAGGTGNPLFTTDTAAVLRAVQLGMDIVLKATRVDGVYSADPEIDSSSRQLPSLSYQQVLDSRLGIMDFCAIDMAREHGMPVRVFDFKIKGNLLRAVKGEPVGTFIGGTDNGPG